MPDNQNALFDLAASFVLHTRQSVFLTGKAGTGKTTFLRHIKGISYKQLAVLAPTGVAAIQATGSTIHSFFQLPFGPFIPVDTQDASPGERTGPQALLSRIRLTREKRNIIRALDLLIIDEVSMVRADLMDAIDSLMRHIRMDAQPFGGVQLLLIGDLHQLPPVIKDQEWRLLKDYYDGPYFFYSHAIQKLNPVYIELDKVYRQQEADYLQLLNEVRLNTLSAEGYDLLHSRYLPHEQPDGYITLTSHNAQADAINEHALNELPGRLHKYKAVVHGDFPASAYPADEVLHLKVGAQVMFTKNDNRSGRYFNGKIGVVTHCEEAGIRVQCDGEDFTIFVTPAAWENFKYQINPDTKQLEETLLGSFEQFPLRLAWAVTIHKSQGLTFDKVIVDAGRSFSPGQAYVALSRCTTLQGMILHSRILPSAIFSDRRIQQYGEQKAPPERLQENLNAARGEFQHFQIRNLFLPNEGAPQLARMARLIHEHSGSFSGHAGEWIGWLQREYEPLRTTGEKFLQQVDSLIRDSDLMPEDNDLLQERIRRAADWFGGQLSEKLLPSLRSQVPETDNQEYSEQFDAAWEELLKSWILWQKMLESTRNGFSTQRLLELRSRKKIEEMLDEDKKARKSSPSPLQRGEGPVSGSSQHPELLDELKKIRNRLAAERGVPHYMIASLKALEAASNSLPRTLNALLQVKGFGNRKVEQFGEEITDAVNIYCLAHGLEGETGRKVETREPKPNKEKNEPGATYLATLEAWETGKSIDQIARMRNLAASTIEGHFSKLIALGRMPVDALLSDEKLEELMQYFKKNPGNSIQECRNDFQGKVSFAQARLARSFALGKE